MLGGEDGAPWSSTMKKLVTVFVLATFVATPVFAAKKRQTVSSQAAAAQAYMPDDRNYPVTDKYTVVVDGQIVGRDPDPNIRFQLLRDARLLAE